MNAPNHLVSLRAAIAEESRLGIVRTVSALCVVGTILIATPMLLQRANERETTLRRETATESAAERLSDRISAHVETLYGVRSGFLVRPDLPRTQFHRLVAELAVDERQPGVQVIGAAHLLPVVTLDRTEVAIDARASSSGLDYPPFEVYPEPTGDVVLPIDYIEPQVGNERAFGLDFLSEPNRRTAALRARDTGEASATGPITLVQETGTQRAILIMLPLYEADRPTSVAQRRSAFRGVVYSAFRMGDLVEAALGDRSDDVMIVDVVTGEHIFEGEDVRGVDPEDLDPALVTGIDVPGRPWRIAVLDTTEPLSGTDQALPYVALAAEIVVLALVTALVLSQRSARLRANRLAAEMTDGLDALTETAAQAIISVDDSDTIVAWNAGATEIFGRDSDDMVGRPVDELFADSPDDGDATPISSLYRHGVEQEGETTLLTGRRHDGREFTAELVTSTWVVRDRRFVTAFVSDVTERVAAQAQLATTSQMLRGVLDSATELSIIATDQQGRIEIVNAGAERMLGYSADELIGRPIDVVHDGEELILRSLAAGVTPPGRAVLGAPVDKRTPHIDQWTYVRKDRSKLTVELIITARLDEHDRVAGYIGVATDVGERVAAERRQQQLLRSEREMVEQLREIDQKKNDFVSTMSHELRTPLTSIIGYSEMLTDEESPPLESSSRQMVDAIDRNAHRLLSLVENLLLLSRIESGSLHSSNVTCDLGHHVAASIEALAPLADSERIDLRLSLDDVAPVLGNCSELERVALNLVSNAIKFGGRDGRVDVTLREVDGVVELVVADDGIGIPADDLPKLFSRFFRSRNAEELAISGTGLGLSIVHTIVQRHGGTIEVESDEGAGTTFVVRLPIAAGSDRSADEPAMRDAATHSAPTDDGEVTRPHEREMVP